MLFLVSGNFITNIQSPVLICYMCYENWLHCCCAKVGEEFSWIHCKVLPDDAQFVCEKKLAIARLFGESNLFDEALVMLYDLKKDYMGKVVASNQKVLKVQLEIAEVNIRKRNYESAPAQLEEISELMKIELGNGHYLALMCIRKMGTVYEKMGKLDSLIKTFDNLRQTQLIFKGILKSITELKISSLIFY